MFKANVYIVCGTGNPTWNYFPGRGCGFSKSPKRALAIARRKAGQQCGANIYAGVVLLVETTVSLVDGKTTYEN